MKLDARKYLKEKGLHINIRYKSKNEGKDKELIQSSTTPDPGYKWESDKFLIRHHKREPKGHINLSLELKCTKCLWHNTT